MRDARNGVIVCVTRDTHRHTRPRVRVTIWRSYLHEISFAEHWCRAHPQPNTFIVQLISAHENGMQHATNCVQLRGLTNYILLFLAACCSSNFSSFFLLFCFAVVMYVVHIFAVARRCVWANTAMSERARVYFNFLIWLFLSLALFLSFITIQISFNADVLGIQLSRYLWRARATFKSGYVNVFHSFSFLFCFVLRSADVASHSRNSVHFSFGWSWH